MEQTRRVREADTKRDLALGAVRSGVVLAQKGDYDGAIVAFRKALALNPELGEAHFNLAGALLQKGEIEGAVETFPAALKLAPHWPEAHYQYGRALWLANRKAEAIAEFRTALQQNPNHAEAKRALKELKAK